MLNKTSKLPAFDLLEITPELTYTPQKYEKLTPVKAGQVLHELLDHQPSQLVNALSGAHGLQQGSVSVPYLNKILVVYFYSKQWGNVSLEHLKQLNAIRNEVKYHDGNLIVIDSDGPASSLQQLLWNNNLSLPVYADYGHQIATQFGVYAENSPTWNRYAGIDENVPLPAAFVLNHFLKVVFDHCNEDISINLQANEILTAVYQSNHYQLGRKSA
jgi:peroxiredoxin